MLCGFMDGNAVCQFVVCHFDLDKNILTTIRSILRNFVMTFMVHGL